MCEVPRAGGFDEPASHLSLCPGDGVRVTGRCSHGPLIQKMKGNLQFLASSGLANAKGRSTVGSV